MDTKELHALIAKKKALKDAAPEMLKALQAIRARINGEFDHESLKEVPQHEDIIDFVLYVANEAIAKAKGE